MQYIFCNLSSGMTLYRYPPEATGCVDCLKFEPGVTDNESHTCPNGHRCVTRVAEDVDVYARFCFPPSVRHNSAKYQAQEVVNGFLLAQGSLADYYKSVDRASKDAIHNCRNLNATITSHVLTLVNEMALAFSDNELEHVQEVVKREPLEAARVLLGVLKSSRMIASEFDVADYFERVVDPTRLQKDIHRLHSLVMLGMYSFRAALQESGVTFVVTRSDIDVYCNYDTTKTALINLLDNAVKYCLPNSYIRVDFRQVDGLAAARFEMMSLELTDADIAHATERGYSGESARRLDLAGEGIGLAVVAAMLRLNGGGVRIGRVPGGRRVVHGGERYALNEFLVELPTGPDSTA